MTREEAIKILRREIECLSHTKCEDCILEAACDPIKTTPYDSEYIEVYEMAIKALEKNESAEEWYKLFCEKWDSAENKGEWIPVSERLPEIHQYVLLSLRSLDIEVGFRAETEPYFYCHGADGCYVEPQNVLAWQLLPEPYKKGGE